MYAICKFPPAPCGVQDFGVDLRPESLKWLDIKDSVVKRPASLSIIVLQAVCSAVIASTQTVIKLSAALRPDSRWKGAPGGMADRGVPLSREQLNTLGLIKSRMLEHIRALYSLWSGHSLVTAVCRVTLTRSRSRSRAPRCPVSPQPASRWALLMSPSRSSDAGLFFPGLEGGHGGGTQGSAGWVRTRQGAGDATRQGCTEQGWESEGLLMDVSVGRSAM